jgi:hypothetical protein
MDRSSNLHCGLSASRRHVPWHANAKAGLLEVNSDSNDDVSAERNDPLALDCDSASIVFASIYFYVHYHLLRHAGFRCGVATSKTVLYVKKLLLLPQQW